MHSWRHVLVTEQEVENEKVKLQDEAYNLEYKTKVHVYQAPKAECVIKKNSYLSKKHNVVNTQKNCLNEMDLLSIHNILKLMGKKMFTI